MPPSLRTASTNNTMQLPPRSPRYPLKTEETALDSPPSPPLPNDAVPTEGDDFVSALSEDFFAGLDLVASLPPEKSLSSSGWHSFPTHKGGWRSAGHNKVASTDVASVGNASDTWIPLQQKGGQPASLSGRALHEHAKVALNREDYQTALQAFEALLEAQIQRFGPCHASVAAAMHNVGGTCRMCAVLPYQSPPYFIIVGSHKTLFLFHSLSTTHGTVCLGGKLVGRSGTDSSSNIGIGTH